MKVRLKRFHLNSDTIGFRPLIQELEMMNHLTINSVWEAKNYGTNGLIFSKTVLLIWWRINTNSNSNEVAYVQAVNTSN